MPDPITLHLSRERAELVQQALSIAINRASARAAVKRRAAEVRPTIKARRLAGAEALDLTARARQLDAIRRELAEATTTARP
jgi:hypothetical protein